MAEAGANTVGLVEPPVSENTGGWNDTEEEAAASVTVTEKASTDTGSGESSHLLPIAKQFAQRASSWNAKPQMTPPRKSRSPPSRAEEIAGQTRATFASQDSGDEADGESDIEEAGTRMTYPTLQTNYNEPPDTWDGDTIPLTDVQLPQKATLSSAPPMTLRSGDADTSPGSTISPIPNPRTLPQDTTKSSTVTLNTTKPEDAPWSVRSTYAPRPPVSTTSIDTEPSSPSRPSKRRKMTGEVPMTTNLTGHSKDPPPGPDLSASSDNGMKLRTTTTDAGATTRPAPTSLPSTIQTTDFATKTDKAPRTKATPDPKVEAEAEKKTETDTSTAKAMRKLEPIDLSSLPLMSSAHESTIPDEFLRTSYLKQYVAERPLTSAPPVIQDRSKCLLGISAPTSWLPTEDDMAEASREYNDPTVGLQKRKEAELERLLLLSFKEAAKPVPLATPHTRMEIMRLTNKIQTAFEEFIGDTQKILDSIGWSKLPIYNGLRQSCADYATRGGSYHSLKPEHKRQLASLGLSQLELATFQQALNLHAHLVGSSVSFAGDVISMVKDGREIRDPQFDNLPQNVSADRVRRRSQRVQKGLMNGTPKIFTRAQDGTELASAMYPRKMWNGVVDLTDRTWASECEPQQYTQGELKSINLATRDGAQLFSLMTDCDPNLVTATNGLPTDVQLTELGKTFKTKFQQVNAEINQDIYSQECEGTRRASLLNDGANAYRASLTELRNFHKQYRRYPKGPVTATLLGGQAVYQADQFGPDNSKHLPRDSNIRTGGDNATFEDPRGEGRVGERLNMLADTLAETVQDWTTEVMHAEWTPATSVRDALVAGITMSRTRDAYSGASLAGPGKFLREVSYKTLGNELRREYDERVQIEKLEERRTTYENLFAAIPETVEETGEETDHETAPAPSEGGDQETAVETDEAGVTVEDSDDETAVESEGSTSAG